MVPVAITEPKPHPAAINVCIAAVTARLKDAAPLGSVRLVGSSLT